jgi:glycosyltransferase involved in cell wall biosynthesis
MLVKQQVSENQQRSDHVPKISIIVPTYNRYQDLKNTIASILKQTLLPDELLIIDDGNLDEVPLYDEIKASKIHLIYHKKQVPGLTESRNKGIELSRGSLIFFFDDDVILHPSYIEQINKSYDNDTAEKVGGIGGGMLCLSETTKRAKFRQGVQILLLHSGIQEGRVLKSGFFTDLKHLNEPKDEIIEVDYLPGCAMSYRRSIFKELSFTSEYRKHAFGEDKDFSYQVAKKHTLLINKNACLTHLESATMRPDKRTYGRKLIIGRYLFFNIHIKKKRTDAVFFWYAVAGYIFLHLVKTLFRRDKNDSKILLGIVDAIKLINSKDNPLNRQKEKI